MSRLILWILNSMMALPGFSFAGIGQYARRGLVCPGVCVVLEPGESEEPLEPVLEYYRVLGIGPSEVITVPNPGDDNLYEAILTNRAARERVVDLCSSGGRVQFHNTRGRIELDFLRALGLDYDHARCASGLIADLWNNKAELRRHASAVGLAHLFAPFRIASGGPELLEAYRQHAAEFDSIMVRPPSWASCLGTVFPIGEEDVLRFATEHEDHLENILVEENVGPHTSFTLVRVYEDGEVADSWFSRQDCPLGESGVSFKGQAIGEIDIDLDDARWLEESADALVEKLAPSDLTSTVSFDAMVTTAGKRYICECNMRAVFSTFLRELQKQVAHARGVEPSAVSLVMWNCHPTSARTLSTVLDELGDTAMQSLADDGVLPYMCFELPDGQFWPIAIARSYEAALRLREAAELRLSR